MSRRLYLVDAAKYRVRTHTGRETITAWCDLTRAFVTGRVTQRRVVPLDRVAAVKRIAAHDAPRRWYAVEHCFRAIHDPARKPVRWVHPYAMARAS